MGANMKNIRTIHLYLGCFFAPLLLFFAISGIWQTFDLHIGNESSEAMALISTIHTSNALKIAGTLSSPILKWFVVLMSISFILTTILGVLIALKHGQNSKAAIVSIVLGVTTPLGMVIFMVLM